MSISSQSNQYHDQAEWPSIVDLEISLPEDQKIKDVDVSESCHDNDDIKHARSDNVASPFLSANQDQENEFMDNLDQSKDQWPTIVDSGDSLPGGDEVNRVDDSDKVELDQAVVKSEESSSVDVQDVQSLLGELRFSDEE